MSFGAQAAEFIVGRETNIDALDGVCSLLEALEHAESDRRTHADCPQGSASGDVLLLDSGYDYALDRPWAGSSNGTPALTGDLQIIGNGASIRRSSKAPFFRIFELGSGNFEFSDLTLRDGVSSEPMDGGGAIRITGGDLVLRGVTLRNNRAEGLLAYGGAIRIDAANVVIEDSVLEDNRALGSSQNLGGGAIQQFGGDLTIRRSALLDNQADRPCNVSNPDDIVSTGGALRVEALGSSGTQTDIEDSTIAGNVARNGGAIAVISRDTPVSGIEDVVVQILGSTVAFNRRDGCGGFGDGIDVNEAGGGEALVLYGNSILLGNGIVDPLGQLVGTNCSSTSVTGDFVSLEGNIVDPNGRCELNSSFDVPATEIGAVVDPTRINNAYAPRASGPAVDRPETNTFACPSSATDQFRNPRAGGPGQGGSQCDIGAIEYQPVGSRFTLNVTADGAGFGTISSTPAGIDCAPDCNADFDDGTVVTLTPQPAPDNTFAGWSGDCSGTGTCAVTMDQTRHVTATFDSSATYPLTVSVLSGDATVTSNPAGVDCAGVGCSADFPAGTLVELIQQPEPGFFFSGWGGACAGDGACTVLMDGPRSVAANYTSVQTFLVSVTVEGQGTVISDPERIACDPFCAAEFSEGETVQLLPRPASDETFLGWSGACSGAASCVLTVDGDLQATASFTDNPELFRLAVQIPDGGGTVQSDPIGIDCPDVCSANFAGDTEVALTPTPDTGFAFDGWRGACSGDGACVVTMDESSSVTADFVAQNTLEVTVNGNGSVESSPSGIACPGDCTAGFISAEKVLLTAMAAPGSEFAGWSGACSGSGPCVVSMDQDRQVTALFESSGFELTVVLEGEGAGQVVEVLGLSAIDCPDTCSAIYPTDSEVTLDALPNIDSVFQGFGGDCQGTNCSLTLDRNRVVRAVFLSDDQLFIDSFE